MIAIHGLSTEAPKREGERRLDGVSLEIAAGEIVSFVGAACSGRRALQSVLALADDDWTGEYVLCGHRVHEQDGPRRAQLRARFVGLADRGALLVDCLSVEENLEIPLAFADVPHERREPMILDVLTRLRLSGIRRTEAELLPPDHRRLAAIAKALVASPRLVIVEEPLASLHPLQVRLLSRELYRLRDSGCAIAQCVEREDGGVAADRVFRVAEGKCLEAPRVVRAAGS